MQERWRPEAGERGGRPAATTAHELAAVAQRLFLTIGFEKTSIEDIARAAGISRRTFFRYFATKADVLFVESPAELARLREGLRQPAPGDPYRAVVTRAVAAALHVPASEHEWARQRAQLILTVPALQAHASLVFAEWRDSAAEFARGLPHTDELFPLAVGHAVLAGTLAAHEHWITHPGSDLAQVLVRMLDLVLPAEPTAR
ncbi:TetR family transcriptional regulator [Geodermatophilus sabuli]|uniref:TetR family transcriptional regulator n=1 Tax=Geodermatophilus sabuli TaxID=1564158 RepID=A0A7K3VWL4_9ACTN|nr:TetR family transcriptional regulator [Geodermatophilus sabuli]NEK56718.1 TetR family transcriptional regulator [Geodermatophilus sabuli]